MTLSAAAKRAARTFAQAAIGVFLSLMASGATGAVPGVSTLKAAALAAGWAGVIAVLSWAHNALEDAGRVPPVLR